VEIILSHPRLTTVPVARFRDDVTAAVVDDDVTGERCAVLQSTFAVCRWKERITSDAAVYYLMDARSPVAGERFRLFAVTGSCSVVYLSVTLS